MSYREDEGHCSIRFRRLHYLDPFPTHCHHLRPNASHYDLNICRPECKAMDDEIRNNAEQQQDTATKYAEQRNMQSNGIYRATNYARHGRKQENCRIKETGFVKGGDRNSPVLLHQDRLPVDRAMHRSELL